MKKRTSRETIIQAAENLFGEKGYNKTTMIEIAGALGMSPANIYRFFHSKDDLRRAVFEKFLETNFSMAVDILRLRAAAPVRIARLLRRQFLMTNNIISNHRNIYNFIALGIERDGDLLAFQIIRLSEVLTEVIIDGIDFGEFAEQDAQAAACALIFATVSLWHPILLDKKWLGRENRPDRLINFVLGTLSQVGNHLVR